MSKLLDPAICPDCRAPLNSAGTCTGCGLALVGPLATRLWQTMTTADTLIEALRRQDVVAPVTAGLPVAPPVTPAPPRQRPAAGRLSSASVPTVLFATGAICLLVAAVVFVAVAWGSLGLGARTSILLAVTTGFAALAARMVRRGLRGAAETFALVTTILVLLDLAAAHTAGLVSFDRLADRYAVAVAGAVLAALGTAAGVQAARSALRFLVVATGAGTLGALLLAAGLAWSAPDVAVGAVLATPALVAGAALLHRMGLRPAALGVIGVALVSWLVLLTEGLNRASEAGVRDWWLGAGCWPLLAAAALAGLAVLAPALRADEVLRTAAAGGSVLAIVLAALTPAMSNDALLCTGAALTVALSLAGITLPRAWALATGAFAALGTTGGLLYLLTRPLPGVLGLPSTGPADRTGFDLEVVVPDPGTAAWTAVVVAVAVAVATGLGLAWITDRTARTVATRTWLVLAPTLVAFGPAVAVLETRPSLLAAVLAWTAVLVVLAVLALAFRGAFAPGVLVAAGYLALVGVRLAAPSHVLVALLAIGLAVGCAVAHRVTTAGIPERAMLAGAVVLAAGFAATHAVYPVGGRGDAAGLALVLVAAVAALLAARLTDSEPERITAELVALVCGLTAAAFPDGDATRIAILTLSGTVIALVSVLHRDRDAVAWLGALVLAVAAIERVEVGLSLPELATAPAAALLLAAGVHRLRRDPGVSSLRALGSGLVLAVLPTLVLALGEPVSIRSLLLGAFAALALAVGVERRWAAPFLAGSAVLVVLAVRHLGPIAEAVPRWVSLGTVGVALLAVAVTWESRRRDLATAERYLVALR